MKWKWVAVASWLLSAWFAQEAFRATPLVTLRDVANTESQALEMIDDVLELLDTAESYQ